MELCEPIHCSAEATIPTCVAVSPLLEKKTRSPWRGLSETAVNKALFLSPSAVMRAGFPAPNTRLKT